MSDIIICPNCKTEITVTEALSKQLQSEVEDKYKQRLIDLRKKQQEQKLEIEKREKSIRTQQENIDKQIAKKSELESQKIRDEFNKKYQQELVKVRNKVQQEITDKNDLELKDLKAQLAEKQKSQQEFEKRELEMRKKQRELEEQQRRLKLEVERQLDIEKRNLQDQIEKEMQEANRLKLLEKDKQISDMRKLVEEAQRKATQGSQQNQGEVLELDLEETLANTFNYDLISPVGKGVHGADIIQNVRNAQSQSCGVILWEIKQTKNWTEKWVGKFKEDLRNAKANLPVLVTTALPKDVHGFGIYKNIWVCLPEYAIQLATVLRKNLIEIAYERLASRGKGKKQELLYNYLSSHEFRQRVEALVEVYQEMQTQINKERAAFEKIWKQREMQMRRFFVSTSGMYGEIQGLVGSSMPEIKGLELESGQDEKQELKLF